MFKKLSLLTSAVALAVGLTACGGSEEDTNNENASVGEKLEYTITGIDPGAGIMGQAEEALSEYGLDNWEIQESSGAAMTAELDRAITEKEPIIVTGWIPHWKFFEYDLKMLEDPKGVFGGEENINTLVRKGLEEDLPGAYTFFDQFEWEPEHLQDVMLKIEKGQGEQEAAKEWASENEDLVKSWVEGAEPGNGAEVKVTYVAWADVIASSNVVKYVLENELDYKVELVQVEPGPMFASVADGSADAMVGAWLPSTHDAYMKKYKDDLVDLGVNLTGTRNGLVVPKYMEIDSIEDLKESK
ncbi:glycine betaine ABC transporter substrate-binding protein [Salinibacillus xinjiangensis]|uniref:Glycine/betaine ABC transporter n=1 Tax=Salinibacillus xinjiangensis TaxID=1229268 RepID=A0A6G1XBD3_9BACI|nr:glycine betaine ABC transporter substrate-binding protein [Salinibacillus xinjiangensis]MRG88098.1 glycine/betaine ABC transporter [Salinibacillus xinjiangensis]